MASAAKASPVPADEINLLAGAHVYQQGRAGCHGRLDQDPATMSKRFYPRPPQLLPPGEGVTDDPVGATHWVVKNSIGSAPNTTLATTTTRTITANLTIDNGRSRKL